MFTISNRIEYLDHVFEGQAIKRGNPYYARSLTSSSLEIDSFDFEVRSTDTTLTQFVRNTPLTYYHDDVQMGIFYVQKIARTTVCTYRFECTSTIGLLDESYHNGGIYTGETVKEVVEDICGPFPVWIKTNIQNIQLYGWLPIATRRENLSQVLFALGATLKVDYNGTLRVEGLWDGQSTEIDAGHMHAGGSVEYSTPVTQVIVTEHAYTANATETTELFNGTTAAGDKITFDEPCYDLVADGFSILESAANYAIVSAGSGTLTGKKYVHTTRQIVKDVQPATRDLVSVSDNVVKVENATLVSLVNASAVADRLVRYYSCTERIVNKMVTQRESPGDVVSVYHPYEGAAVRGCIESSDVTVSGKLASTESILVGYTPPDIGEQEYYDTVEVVTQSGAWTVPQNVTSIRVVLIGGGSPGSAGEPGEDGEKWTTYSGVGALGGKGGAGGEGGTGGKILQINVSVTPNELFDIVLGSGGGAGEDGTDTTFGDYSTSNGASSESGFLEPITGVIYASRGVTGINGGQGGDGGGWYRINDELEIRDGTDGESIDGARGGAGQKTLNERGDAAGGGGGGGAAYQSNGGDGTQGTIASYAQGGNGGNGATPQKASAGVRGSGGQGGAGGGGGGGAGYSNESLEYCGENGKGGAGGEGGDGGPGCVLIYYRVYKENRVKRFCGKGGVGFNDKYKRMVVA